MNKLSLFPVLNSRIPFITTEQMIEVDRLMIEEYGINLFQMMENAGRCLAIVTREMINFDKDKKILLIAGSGGNGGGGMTAARRLHSWGYDVDVLVTSKYDKFKGTIKSQLDIIRKIGMNISEEQDFDFAKKYNVIVDAMIGYSLKGKLRQNIIDLIDWVNIQNSEVISLDVPSGMDSTTGSIKSTCIKADQTMTLALPKTGFQNPEAKNYTGELLLADISVPPQLYKDAFDIELPDIFNKNDIVRI